MTKPLATRAQMLGNKLTNRVPVICAVCDHYITPFTGLPVFVNARASIIEFAHAGCCARRPPPRDREVTGGLPGEGHAAPV